MRKRIISALLCIVMLVGLLPTTVFAAPAEGTTTVEHRIVHLDCGRKYFSVSWIKALIAESAAAGYNEVELAFGNDGLRFVLDNMDLTSINSAYTSDYVKNKIQDGNETQNSSGDGSYLTQAEMTEIITYAKTKGVEIVPLLNLPGHANTILYIAGDTYNYATSQNTLDVTNEEAVNFAMAIFQKYVDYFAGQGCHYFNFGADEFANDIYANSFAGLNSARYSSFVTFINSLASYIKGKDMTPRAFNDGLYYGSYSGVTIDTGIQVCYWSSGWNGYDVASASFIATTKGHGMINTHGDYYYVLGKTSKLTNGEITADGFDVTSFPGGTVSDPVGAMFCIWCDYPNAQTEKEVANDVLAYLTGVGNAISGTTYAAPADGFAALYSSASESEQGLVDSEGDPVTELLLTLGSAQTVSVTGMEEGASLSASVDDEDVITAEVNGSSITVTPVGVGTTQLTATVTPQTRAAGNENTYTIPVTVQADAESETRAISLVVGDTETDTITGANHSGAYTAEPAGIATVEVTGTDATEATTQYTEASVTCYDLISSDSDDNWKAVSGYYYKADDGNYYPVYAKRSSSGRNRKTYTYTWGYSTTSSTSSVKQIGTQRTNSTGTTPNITVYTKSDTDGTPASTTVTFTGLAAGTATVTVGHVTYNVTVSPQPISTDLTAEFWCTNTRVTGAVVNATSMPVPFTEVNTPVFAVNAAPRTGTGDGDRNYVYWKSVILPEGSHQTTENGVDQTNSGTENIAVMYDGTDYYYYAKNDPNTAVKIKSTDQLVCYYKQVFVQLERKHGAIAGADWGEKNKYSWAPNSVTYTIVETDESGNQLETKSTTMWYGPSGEIKAIDASVEEGYEVYKLTVKKGDTTTTYGEGGSQDIPEELVLERGSNYEVTYYIRPVNNLRVTYYWLGAPTGQTLPTDSTIYSKNQEVTVDTTYTDGKTVTSGTDEYTFHGWYGDNTFTGNPVTRFTITVPTTLYGYWTRVDTNGLRIEAASDTKVYDGTPLTKNEYTVSYAGIVLTADADGWYEANDIRFKPNATVSGSQTDVGSTGNQISGTIQYAEDSTGTFSNVQWKSGTLKVTPKITVNYYQDSTEGTSLGSVVLTDTRTYQIGDTITLTSDQLNAHKPTVGYSDGVQQGAVPYTVTSDNVQTIDVVYVKNIYTISWDTDGDGDVDDTTRVAYGEIPTHADSSKAADAQYTYTFTGWTPQIVPVTDDATYTAQFDRNAKPYNPPVAPKLNKADHYAYVVGYPDGTVQPQGAITRAEVATIFFRLLSDETRDLYWTKSNGYTDVKAGDWFNNAVSTLSNAGIINGYPDGTFRPNAPITRAEMAKVIAMFAELNKDSEGFKDIAGHWAEAYIKLAAGNGWIAGYPDGTFRPDQYITRAETMTMINRVLERVPSTEKHLLAYEVMLTFPDNQPGDWYYIAVQEATNSHTYERYATEKNGDEQWIKLIDNYDWTKLEF